MVYGPKTTNKDSLTSFDAEIFIYVSSRHVLSNILCAHCPPSDSSDCSENCQILLSETNYYPKKMGDSEELEVNENGLKVFSMEEVEKHTEAKGDSKSIWTVIHDKVYDVTKFLDEVSWVQSSKNTLTLLGTYIHNTMIYIQYVLW